MEEPSSGFAHAGFDSMLLTSISAVYAICKWNVEESIEEVVVIR
jgi:hypothetical protein